jgi:2-keto-3-deoxy-L-rhamnonate aldolase RhmA
VLFSTVELCKSITVKGIDMVFVQRMMPSDVSQDMSCYLFIRKCNPDVMCEVHTWRLMVINIAKIFALLSLVIIV